MNRIYKVIWSKVRHCYVVVSELAKKDGKSVSTRARVSKKMAASLAVMALCAGMTTGVMAADTATGTGSGIAYGTGSKAPNASSVALGRSANASGDFSIALGLQANSSGYLSIAQGYAAQSSGLQSVAIGLQTQATNEASTAIGRSVQATGLAAIGIGLSGVAAGNDSIVMGREATATTTAVNGIALGIGSYIGAEVTPGGQPSEGVPDNSLEVTDDDTSSGKPNQDHMNSIALGNTAKAFGYQNTSLGAGAETYDTNSLAVGVAAHARGNYASAIGKQASAYGLESTALGHWARAYGDNAIAIGTNSITFSLDGTDSVNNAIAIGQKARVASNNSIALGQNSLAYIPTGVATKAYLTDEAFSADNGIVSVGNMEYKIGEDAVTENRRRITNVAGGAESYDAVNVAQLKAVNDKVDDNKISFFSVKPTGSKVTSNENNEGATGTHAMAIGIDASASGTEGIAIGKAAVSTGATSISMGKKSSASGSSSIAIGQSAASSASNAIALGSSTEASSNYTVALGHYAKATALQGVAMGPYAKAEKDSSVAIGYFAKATDGASNGVSIGRAASVTKSNGVALGYISVADRSSGVTGYNPMTQTAPGASNTAIAQAWGFADEYNTLNTQLSDTSLTTEQKNAIRSQINKLISPYKSGYGAVSVGTGESTRQIINVAAGTEDSDAVNLGQLKALANKVDSDKIQYFSVKSTTTANQDNSGATGTDTIAIGPNAKARYTGGIAIGKDATAAAGSMAALAIGYETNATGVASTAIGVRSKATGSSVTAVGFDSVIKTASSGSGRTGDYSVALGVSSLVDGGKSAIAIGNNAYSIDTTQATVVGTGAMVSALPQNSGDSIVITDGSQGTKTITKGDEGEYTVESTKDTTDALKQRNGEAYGATALGSRATAHNLGAVAVGLYSTAIGDTSVAIGNNSMTLKDSAVAVGSGTIASAEDALSLGSYANASKDTAVALGAYAKTDRDAGELFGYVPELTGDELTKFQTDNADSVIWNSNRGAVSVGIKGKETRQITNVAAGTIDTDAVNVAQLKAAKVEVLAGTNISSIDKDTSAGYTQYTVNAKDTITDSATLSGDTITFTRNDGTTYKVSGLASTSALETNKTKYFSVNSSLDGNKNNDGATGINAIAAGGNSTATGNYSTALGSKTSASAERAVAIGYLANSSGMSAVALGNRTKATGATGIAIGSTAESAFDGIALGATAKALTSSSMALGTDAEATGFRATAFSNFANAAGEEAMAFGYKSQANGNFSTAIGSYAWTNGKYSLAFGDQAFVGKMTKEEDSDLVNDPSVPSVRLIDWYSEEKLMTPLTENEYANSMALGKDAKGYGFQTTAIGSGAEAYDTNTLAVGFSSNAKGHFSNAIGGGAQTNGKYATAVGFKANAEAESALALGDNANATISNGVALGSASKTNVDAGILGYDPSGKITSQEELLGNNKATYDSLQNDISTAKDTITSLANEIVALQNNLNTADSEQASSINSDIRRKERALKRARAALVEKESEANKFVSTWQATGAAISIGNSEIGLTRQITNVAAGTADTDAVNVAQLKQFSEKVAQDVAGATLVSGKNITIDKDTNKINLDDKITLNNAAAPGQQVVVDGTTSNIAAGTGDNQVVVDGSAGQVTIGAGDSQLVIGKQADTAKDKDGNVIDPDKTGNYITGLDNTTWNPAEKGIVENRAATEGQLRDAVNSISTEIGDINTDIEAIQNAKRDFISDTGEKIEVSNAETLSIKGGAAANSLTEGNIGVVNDGTKGFKVKLSSKLSGLDSVSAKTLTASDSITVGSGDTTTVISGDAVTTGNTTVNTKGLTVAGSDDSTTITVQSDNVSMGGNKIQNVAAGKDITDAVNVGQLNEAVTTIGSGMNQLGNQINKLDNRVDRVGAGAAALAALHPLEYDPTTRWEVSAGIGNYRGANAVAVGAFYRPNYDTMISIGSSYGGGENMVNAGVTWRIGEGTTKAYPSKDAMAQEIDSLRSVVDQQNDKLAAQNDELAAQNNKIASQSEQLAAQTDELKAQRQQLEEQSKQIAQLMQAIEDLKK